MTDTQFHLENERAFMLKGKMKSQYAIRSKFAQLIPFSLDGPQVCTGVKRLAPEICFSNRGKLITDMSKFVRDLKALQPL